MIADVVIAGAGPNGLALACELALAGVRPIVLERLPEPSDEPKANGMIGQVVRMVDRRGLYERLSGSVEPPRPNSGYFMFGALFLDLSLLDQSPLYVLPAAQQHLVRVLAERALELGAEIRSGHELTGLAQDEDGVTLEVTGPDGPYRLQTRYHVGAEGARSVTRKQAGIGFPGVSYDRTTLRTAHATVPAEWINPATGALEVPGHGTVLPFLSHRTERGGFAYAPLPGQSPTIATTEWDQPESDEPMSLDELRASVRRVLGVDVPLGPPEGDGPHLLRRRNKGNTRVADRFRSGRVFLVGDAAHIYVAGGAGLNLGMQDAVNLGWKLAAVLRGTAPDGLLDTYESERRQAAERTIVFAGAQQALVAPGDDVTALRQLFTELLGDKQSVQRIADLMSGTDIRYDMGLPDPHPLVGWFAPDLDLHTADGPVRLTELCRTGRPLLLDLTGGDAVPGLDEQVDVVSARSLTPIDATALLIRPDSYVAWACSAPRLDLAELTEAASRWFGSPTLHRGQAGG
ncbi:FAD-dependent monooxygenase [Kutzneria albida]|uniref:FAD-binding domain-containing protein n=1 Tax=Kutzneria albida DSM 43870 TaxID=1449976 RepID=W5WAW6_9PSEU|nr:FAD-dependent monooxygenase [Kutzneria albida]AHH97646.1 hypothetical protein KALB_4284 [Kutzneria albida DSM 43870]